MHKRAAKFWGASNQVNLGWRLIGRGVMGAKADRGGGIARVMGE